MLVQQYLGYISYKLKFYYVEIIFNKKGGVNYFIKTLYSRLHTFGEGPIGMPLRFAGKKKKKITRLYLDILLSLIILTNICIFTVIDNLIIGSLYMFEIFTCCGSPRVC